MIRVVLVLLFLACGRGGEIADMSWLNCLWCGTEMMFTLLWGQLKTGRQKVINFPCDYDCPEMDFYHSMGSYLMFYTTTATAVFPSLKRQTGSSAAVCTTYLKTFTPADKNRKTPTVKGLSNNSTSHGVRIGAANEMVRSPTCGLFNAIARGGWDTSMHSDSNLWLYLLMTSHVVATGGRALAGWPNSRNHVVPPKLVFLNAENRARVDSLLNTLFQGK